MARSEPPVFSSQLRIHFQRSSGFWLSNVVHRDHLIRLVAAVPVDDVAMQVVAAAGVRRPFVADERGEPSRLVVPFHDLVVLLPDRLRKFRVHDARGELLIGLRLDQLHRRGRSLLRARQHHVVPALHHCIGHQLGIAGLELGNHAHRRPSGR